MPYSATGAIATVTFWSFLAIAVIVGNVIPFLKDRESQRTIRHLAEKGQALDPTVVDALVNRSRPDRREFLNQLLLAGTILPAVGVGLGFMGYMVSLQAGKTIFPIYGAGVMVFLIGVAILFYARQGLAQLKPEGQFEQEGRGGR